MYKTYPSFVLGFHTCERTIGEAILAGDKDFKASENAFDWLGHGMYFWGNDPHRAFSYGQELKTIRKKLVEPTVQGNLSSNNGVRLSAAPPALCFCL